jgi:hypothetical protein
VKALCCALALIVASPAWADPAAGTRAAPAPTKPAELPPLSPLQSPEASLSPLHLHEVDLVRVERRARLKRNIGIGLTIPGVVLVVLGSVLAGAGIKSLIDGTHLVTAGKQIAAGAAGGAIGVVLTIPGAVLWVKGQDDLDVAAWRRRRMETDPTR